MEKTKRRRAGWLPRYKEREGGQCASCPFLKDNDKQFGAVVDRLRGKASPIATPTTLPMIRRARQNVMMDVALGSGDFVCHTTAYGPDMEVRPVKEHRQCPGATRFVKGESDDR